MSQSHNRLVDPDSRVEKGDYLPGVDDPGSDYGGTSKYNPFTPGPGYTTAQTPHWFSGLPVLDTAQYYAEDVYNYTNGDVAAGFKVVVDGIATAYEAVAFGESVATLDGGALIAPVAAWILDHVKPIKGVVDLLGGNPDLVRGVADTWVNIRDALEGAGTDLQASAAATAQDWKGSAADMYRGQRATELATMFGTAASYANTYSLVMTTASELVAIARGAVRDVLAIVIGELVWIATEALATGGTSLLGPAEGQAASALSRALAAVTKILRRLLTQIAKVAKSVGRIFSVIKELITIIDRVINHDNT